MDHKESCALTAICRFQIDKCQQHENPINFQIECEEVNDKINDED